MNKFNLNPDGPPPPMLSQDSLDLREHLLGQHRVILNRVVRPVTNDIRAKHNSWPCI